METVGLLPITTIEAIVRGIGVIFPFIFFFFLLGRKVHGAAGSF
jgi:hypothetical protein